MYIFAYILWNDEAAQPTADITDSLTESNTEKETCTYLRYMNRIKRLEIRSSWCWKSGLFPLINALVLMPESCLLILYVLSTTSRQWLSTSLQHFFF